MNANIVALALGEMAFVAFVLWLAAAFMRDRARHRAELQRAVVERFGSVPDFIAFLETPPGRRFQASLVGRQFRPMTQVLAAVLAGIVLVTLGIGLLVGWRLLDDRDLVVAGIVASALGVGFLVAAFASHRLIRSLGLLPGAVETGAPIRG